MNIIEQISKVFIFFVVIGYSSVTLGTSLKDVDKGVFRILLALSVEKLDGVGVSLPSDLDKRLQKEKFVDVFLKEDSESYRVLCFKHKSQILCSPFFGTDGFKEGYGTAFAITEKLLVTNYHVIKPKLKNERVVISVLTGKSDDVKIYTAKTVIWSDKEKNLAIVEVDGLNATNLTLGNPINVETSLPITSVGFSASSDLVNNSGDKTELIMKPQIVEGAIASLDSYSTTNVTSMIHSAKITGGISGGPVVDNCGNVVGISDGSYKGQNNLSRAINIKELIPALQSKNIEFSQSSGQCTVLMSKIYDVKNWLIIGAIAVLGIILLLVAVFSSKPKNQVKPSRPNISEGLDGEWQIDDNGREFRWDLRQGGMVWRDEVEKARLIEPAPQPKPSESKVTISLYKNDILIGQTELHDNQTLTIGRNGDLRIANSIVSSRHVQVQMTNGVVSLEDLNSTNGTFYSGEEIVGKVLIERTERFLLGKTSTIELLVSIPDTFEIEKAVLYRLGLYSVGSKNVPPIFLQFNDSITVGRGSECDVQITENFVSRLHCTFSLEAIGKITVEDNDSKNGIFVNSTNNRVKRASLSKGDRVIIVNEQIIYEF